MVTATDLGKRMQKTVYRLGFRGGWYGSVGHSCGLPGGSRVLVTPEYSPIDGGAVVIVTPETVSMWVCPYPSNRSDWRWRESFGDYRSSEELKTLLLRATKQPKGMWGEA